MQPMFAVLSVAVAAVYLGWRFVRMVTDEKPAGGCGDCTATRDGVTRKQLVTLEANDRVRR